MFLCFVTLTTVGLLITSPKNSNSSHISFIPYSNVVNDMSLNQEADSGFIEYGETFGENHLTWIPDNSSPSTADFIDLINTSIDNGATVNISTGFTPEESFRLVGKDKNYSHLEFGLTDNDTAYSAIPNGYDHSKGFVNNVVFVSSELGFNAGLSASIVSTYLSLEFPEIYGTTPLAGMWGGMNVPGVYDNLSGFEQGVNWFNYAIMGYTIDSAGNTFVSPTVNEVNNISDLDVNSSLKLAHPGKPLSGINKVGFHNGHVTDWVNVKYPDYSKVAPSSSNWYVGNFDPEDSSAANKAQNMSNNDVGVIFPVAGGQTFLAFTEAPSAYKIGVDTDISIDPKYNSYRDKIIGTAIKDVSFATQLLLWKLDRYKNYFNDSQAEYLKNYEARDVVYYDAMTIPHDDPSGRGWAVDYDYNNNGTIVDEERLYLGNYNNGGIDFTYSDNYSILNTSWSEIYRGTEGFSTLVSKAFELNKIIERNSPTFAKELNLTPITTSSLYPWIPDWNLYR